MWLHNKGFHKLTLEHKMVRHTDEGYVDIMVINVFSLLGINFEYWSFSGVYAALAVYLNIVKEFALPGE